MRIFLSHSTTDRTLAESLKELLEGFFGERSIQVEFSSDQAAGGGIPPGALWLPWILQRITQADKAYVLLTPGSLTKPWVLWESGAAAGVALASKRTSPVVPITFLIDDDDVPSPLQAAQLVRGDTAGTGGITRLLQDINEALGEPLSKGAFDSTTRDYLPRYLSRVEAALQASSPVESLLASVPHLVDARDLAGLWVTCYAFKAKQATAHHADVVQVTPASERRLRARDFGPRPRTDGHATPFRDEIEAELANRHVIGHWRNVSDTRYFGSVHLAVLPGETVMEGRYTGFKSDVAVTHGQWRWVRLDAETVRGVDLSRLTLRAPSVIRSLLEEHSNYAGPLALSDVVEES